MPNPPSSGSTSANPLPPKENALFKRILKCYEQKQYKNGLKFAKQILTNQKFTEHGETLAMKGLTLNCLGRKTEAYDHVRRGLRNDLRSHVCWHVYGLLQRSDKEYEEAIKCYRNALRWDKDNIQILRDLSLLQIQMRDLEGYKETRYQLFQLRPTQRASWIGFAMSYHLLKDYDMALKILEEFRKTQQKAAYDYEHSELLLYQSQVIQESGDSVAALEHLNKYDEQICDKTHLMKVKGVLLMKHDRHAEAETLFKDLIKKNPENHEYYKLMEQALKIEDDEDKKVAMYEAFKEQYPRAQVPQRLILNTASAGETFRKLTDEYMRKALRKGVPPLFVDIKPLYADPAKKAIIEDLCEGYQKNLRRNCSFDEKEVREPATALLWVLYYLSQHHDWLGAHDVALETVNEAIEHTPTLIELFLLKAKIYKHVGDAVEAVKWLDMAQSLDTADRYINCKCAKYLMRANQIKDSEDMCAKFTREGVSPVENLNEMQCMWFQTEAALAHKRMGAFGEALKKCLEVDRHFTEIIEDQFDFHTYCMRKMTLRSYVDLLRLEDVLRSHKFYERAAHTAISVYLRLHDKPVTDSDQLNEMDTASMDPSELKKLLNKQKKAKRKAEQEKQQEKQLAARKELHNKSQRKGGEEELDAPQKDELLPEKLERPEDALAEALKFLVPLQALAADRLKTHTLAFQVYYRRQKPLLMLQSLKRALKAKDAAGSPELHECVVRFQHWMETNGKGLAAPVKSTVEKETKALFQGKTAKQRNAEFTTANKDCLHHAFVSAKMLSLIDSSKSEGAVKGLMKLDSFKSGVDISTCCDILSLLSAGDFPPACKPLTEPFRAASHKRFPLAEAFREETEALKNNTDDEKTHREP